MRRHFIELDWWRFLQDLRFIKGLTSLDPSNGYTGRAIAPNKLRMVVRAPGCTTLDTVKSMLDEPNERKQKRLRGFARIQYWLMGIS